MACKVSATSTRQIGRLPLQWKLVVFRQRQLTQVAHQSDQVAGLAVQIGDLGLVQRIDVIQGGAQIAFQDGQRRAQLVRDVRHQVVAQKLGMLQIGGHLVEGVCQIYHLPAAVRFDAHAKFPPADAVAAFARSLIGALTTRAITMPAPNPTTMERIMKLTRRRAISAAGRHRSPIVEQPAGSRLLGDSRRLTDIGRRHDGRGTAGRRRRRAPQRSSG